jgi:serine/threonine protein kinase
MQSGNHFDRYEILSAIGAGGMGQVYRARDTTLGREVAIKVLREAFAREAERMARFQREAKVLVSLPAIEKSQSEEHTWQHSFV